MKATRVWLFLVAGLVALFSSLNAGESQVRNQISSMTTVSDEDPPLPDPDDISDDWILR